MERRSRERERRFCFRRLRHQPFCFSSPGANPAKVEDFGDKDLLQHIDLVRILRRSDSNSPGGALSKARVAAA